MEALDLFEVHRNEISTFTPLDAIFTEYNAAKEAIKQVALYVNSNSGVMVYFFHGVSVTRGIGNYSVTTFFDEKPALASLDAEYWSKAMNMTDVLEQMSAKYRNEWNEQIRKLTTPAFDRDSVVATMNDLLLKREWYFNNRVDGLFQRLSGNHVTNQPEGFSKRMILERMMTYYGTVDHETGSFVHDLRVLIGRFMGREIPSSRATDYDIAHLYDSQKFGKWHNFDGGAFRFKIFKKGTAHLEVSPHIAHRLNMVLAKLHPSAIPAKFRSKPNRVPREHVINMDILPFKVITELGSFSRRSETCLSFQAITEPTEKVLEYIGGEKIYASTWEFNYPVIDVIHEIMRTGELPEKKSHQFFQTPEVLS